MYKFDKRYKYVDKTSVSTTNRAALKIIIGFKSVSSFLYAERKTIYFSRN